MWAKGQKPLNNSKSTIDRSDTSENDSMEKPSSTVSIGSTYSTETYISAAKCIAEQIKEDKIECCDIIARYGVDPNEFLRLLEEWTQHMIYEYKNHRERFKILLKERWENGDLDGLKSSDDFNRRLIHSHIQKLTQWSQTILNELKRQLDELQPTSNVKQIANQLIEDLLQIMSSVILIHENLPEEFQHDRTKITGITNHLNETIEQLKRIQKINEKEYNIVCIIGLEKAGKSSFINALLGFELLPYRIERCTQIQTILRPPLKDNSQLFASIEFYNQEEFASLMHDLPKEKDENDQAFEKRVKTIRQLRQNSVSEDRLIQELRAADENERRRNIQKLHEYIADISYLNIVRHVTIYTDKLPGENYILLDVPGCDSPMIEHRSSAINAVQNADAFLFLTDGQRPSLTYDQISLLKEIQEGHVDGMKRAFGIITKLDLCQTREKYLEHRRKSQSELESKGFLPEHIFPLVANIQLLEETRSDMDQLNLIKQRIHRYDSLLDGFDKCKKSLNHHIEFQLPYSRFRQLTTLTQQRIYRYVQDALKLGQQFMPINSQENSLDDYIKQINNEKWNEIFENERYQPILARASLWQKEKLALKRYECTLSLTNYFHDQFHNCVGDILSKSHPIEQVMLEQHDISIFQMNPYDIETRERAKIVQSILQSVKEAANLLAVHMYERYVSELETILNEICPEQRDLFQTSLKLEDCAIEVRTLISRVTHPITLASIRWPNVYKDNRIEAARELTRISPMIALNIRENASTNSNETAKNLAQTIGLIFGEIMNDKSQMAMFTALFRR